MAYNRRGYGMTTYAAVGDPFLGGLLKGAGKLVGGAVKGFVSGGPLGALTGAAGAVFGGGSAVPAGVPMMNIAQRPISVAGKVQMPPFGFPAISGGLSLGAPVGPMTTGAMVGGVVEPKGYHRNKTGYFLKSGQYVPPGTKWVRNRRTNPANGRALRKAVSRTSQFNNLVKRSRKNLRALAKV